MLAAGPAGLYVLQFLGLRRTALKPNPRQERAPASLELWVNPKGPAKDPLKHKVPPGSRARSTHPRHGGLGEWRAQARIDYGRKGVALPNWLAGRAGAGATDATGLASATGGVAGVWRAWRS